MITVSNVNAKLVSVGKKSVGFANPTLYSYPTYFSDIVYSNNLCDRVAGQASAFSGVGAAVGYDPVSGVYVHMYICIYVSIYVHMCIYLLLYLLWYCS